jgi:hypothetical protein
MVAGSLLTIAGYQVFTFGLFSVVGSDPIRQSRDPVTETLGVWLSLERGAVVGMAILIAGTLHASSLVAQWATSGFIAIPVTVASLGSFTAIILGIQTVFSAFFLSELAESRPQ